MVLAAVLAALGLKRGRFRAFMMTQALLILVFVLSIWGAFASAVSSLQILRPLFFCKRSSAPWSLK